MPHNEQKFNVAKSQKKKKKEVNHKSFEKIK